MSKALGLFSGGLDSYLSALILKKQNIDITLLHFVSPYFGYKEEKLKEMSEKVKNYGFKIFIYEFKNDYVKNVLLKPKHRYGKAINPCIDCHRYMLTKAKEIMLKEKFDFIFTGEVLGQRPMSQNKNMLKRVEIESGLEGFLLRPLSAKLLEETSPEKNNIVNRSLLLNISGRGRNPQIALAKELNLKDYPQPAGGCRLTDVNLKKRFFIMKENIDLDWDYMNLLKMGRHFFINNNYFITARDESEAYCIMKFLNKGIFVRAIDDSIGSVGLILGKKEINIEDASLISNVLSRYIPLYKNKEEVEIGFFVNDKMIKSIKGNRFNDSDLKKYLL